MEALAADLGVTGCVARLFHGLQIVPFNGVSAVIAFFVISGICIHLPSHRLRTNDMHPVIDAHVFWVRRGVRVGIPVIVSIALGTGLTGDPHLLNPVLWSLYCELIYYAIYPVLLRLAFVYGWNGIFVVSTLICALLCFFDSGGSIWSYGNGLTWLLCLPAWLLGVLIVEHDCISSVAPSKSQLNALRAGVWLLSALAGVVGSYTLHAKASVMMLSPVAAIWIIAEINYSARNGVVYLLERLGRGSYSLYLCHIISISLLSTLRNPYVHFVVGILASASISFLFYLLIEKPSHHLAKNLASRLSKLRDKIPERS